jgi:glycosyltransferase involved in cell wall biosynthesis
MLCGCVPVTSDRGALPEVLGDAGFLVKYGEVEAIIDSIQKALASDKGSGARNRIVAKFPLEKRRRGLFGIVDECLEGK